jgi:hypothetical protein
VGLDEIILLEVINTQVKVHSNGRVSKVYFLFNIGLCADHGDLKGFQGTLLDLMIQIPTDPRDVRTSMEAVSKEYSLFNLALHANHEVLLIL